MSSPSQQDPQTFTGALAAATEAEAVAQLAQDAAVPSELDPSEVYSVITPAGAQAQILDLERLLHAPRRAHGVYRPATVDAFVAHVSRHRDETHTTVWVHPTSGQVIAVLNDHGAGGLYDGTGRRLGAGETTGWRDHRSVLNLQHTPEWNFWLGKSGQLQTQLAFAEHIEEGLKEIVEPAAADMLELAQTFHATQAGTFRSAHRLHNGTVQVQYDETTDAVAGHSQQLEVPQEFTLSIAPFLGEPPWKVTARLRYRLNAGVLKLGYTLDRPEEIIRQTLADIAERLTDEFTHVFLGEPAE